MLKSRLRQISQRGIVLASLGLLATTVSAETNRDWLGSSTAWGTAANWNGGVPTSTDNASFSGAFTGASQPQVQTSQATTIVNGVWMTGTPGKSATISRSSTNGLTITPIDTINGITGLGILVDNTNAFALSLNLPIALGANQEWRNTTENILNLTNAASVVSGTSDLTLRTTGATLSSSIRLNAASTFSGQLTVAQGVLRVPSVNNVSANGPLGNSTKAVILGETGDRLGVMRFSSPSTGVVTSSKPFTLASGGRGGFWVDSDSTSTPVTLQLSGLITGGGKLIKLGAMDNTAATTLELTNSNNDWTGGTLITDGYLSVAGANRLGTGTVTIDYQPQYISNTGQGHSSGAGLKLTGNSTLDTASASPRNVVIGSGGGTIDVTTTTSSLAGDGALSGAGALTKAGTGTLSLNGDNSGFTGTTTVAEGTLSLTSNGSFAASPVVQVNSGTTLDISTVTGGANFAGGSFSLASGQTLKGNGTVTGPVRVGSGATLAPGTSIGTLEVHSGATIDGTLKIEYDVANATPIDLLNNFGDLTITSNATVDFDNLGASALTGGPFIFASYSGTLTGTFTAGHVLDLPSGYGIQYDYLGANIALVASSGINADFNGNNVVDAADYVLWRKNFGATGSPTISQGNSDGDNDVDNDDYNNWRAHFGSSSGSGSGQTVSAGAVPEPTSILLTGLSCVLALLTRARRRR